MWRRVALFYALACAWSWPFFWWRDALDWRGWPFPSWIGTLAIMAGPGLAALACGALFRAPRRTTLAGAAPARALLFAGAPLVAAALVAPRATLDLLALVPLGILLTLGEEWGWRGWLHDALRVPLWAKALVVGVLWEAWHFTTRTYGRPPARAVVLVGIFLAGAILLSLVAAALVERTGAVLVAVGVHVQANLLAESPGLPALLAVGATLMAWGVLLHGWPARPDGVANLEEPPSLPA